MIKLHKLNKYFNRKKTNEIHVINEINLELPEKGLVILLGPSGSGKTTLLNVLGGLDKVQSGQIEFDDKEIRRYSSRIWDEIRNKDVGYIFQNYNLLTNLTVYDNIALTLNMVGVVDKEEIDNRIDYILENIGMLNYRKRRAFQLSGGQQQRVAIARALAKNPKVIIADEPTGNLDSKNTLDIMNIIKKISQTKLVVLVTHEEELAEFYADRVIKLRDGQIVEDYQNSSSNDLDLKHETDIYLKDLNQLSDISDEVAKVKVYSDETSEPNFNVKLIVKNKTLYLDIKTEDYKNIKLLGNDSEIKIIDRHFEKVKKADLKDSSFDLESVIDESKTIHKRSVITFKESFRLAKARLSRTSRAGKLMYIGFIGGAILIAISVGMLSSVYHLDPAKFLSGPKETVVIEYEDYTYDELIDFETEESINYVSLITSRSNLQAKLPTIYQSRDNFSNVSSILVNSDYLDAKDILPGGRGVEDYNEIVLDYSIAKEYLNSYSFNSIGIDTLDDLLEIDLLVQLKGAGRSYEYTLDIVGFSDTGSPSSYVMEETMYMIETGIAVYEIFEDSITFTEGGASQDINDLIVFDDPAVNIPLANYTVIEMDNLFHVSGLYETTEDDIPQIMISLEHMKELYFDDNYSMNTQELFIHSNDLDDTEDYFKSLDIESVSLYKVERAEYRLIRLANSAGTVIFTLVVLAAMSISYFFIIRSSLISRIYEVSVYRALGVTKGDIRKIFFTEIILITSLTSILGYLVTTYVLFRIQLISMDYFEFIYISFYSLLGGMLLIYLINIISGLLPVSNLLRRTPAEILSKYDF